MEFRDKDLQRFYESGSPLNKIPPDVRQRTLNKLQMLRAAQNINELRVPPSNHLEKLVGNLSDYHSIRVNQQYRLIFQWKDGEAKDVYFDDYH